MIERLARKVGRTLAGLRQRSFRAEKWWQLRSLGRQLDESRGVAVVHQMSKVGSSTVVASLKNSAPDILVLHSHFMSEPGLDWLENWVKDRWGTIHVPKHLWHGLFAQRLHYENTLPDRMKVVTLVRDPVARAISEFFEELDVHTGYPYAQRLEANGVDAVADELERMLLETLATKVDWSAPYEWFDREVRDVFGVDLLAEAFDPEADFGVFRSETADILLLKLERLADCAEQAFGDFLGIPDFSLDTGRNVASRKYYADAYRMILARLSVPEAILEACYGSRHVRHFYGAADIDRFTARWTS